MTSLFREKLIVVRDRSIAVLSLPLWSFYFLYLSTMARMPKFRRLTNGELMLGYTKEADEVFKKNSAKNEPQIMSKAPEKWIKFQILMNATTKRIS